MNGTTLTKTYTSNFTTAIVITSINPKNSTTGIPPNKIITITFSDTIQAGTNYNNIKVLKPDGTGKAITKNITGNTLTITSNYNWEPGNTFTIYIPINSIINTAGSSITHNYNSTFTTTIITLLTVHPLSGYKTNTVNINSKLTDTTNNPISGKTIKFRVNGTNIGTSTTNTQGIATLQYTIDLNPRTYTIEAIFDGDNIYENSYKTTRLSKTWVFLKFVF
jgi:hypothetical protein